MSIASRLLGLAVKEGEKLLVGDAEKAAEKIAVRRAAAPEAQARRLAIKRAATEVQPLPRPAQPLALPKPAPKPKGKPRGGQWFPDQKLGAPTADMAGFRVHDRGPHADPQHRYAVRLPGGETFGNPVADLGTAQRRTELRHKSSMPNWSPEHAAARTRGQAALVDWTPEGEVPDGPGPATQLGDWLEKAYAKYLRNDFGTDQDPLQGLAARGLHFDPEMTPARWADEANDHIMEDPIGYYTVPRHESSIALEHASSLDDLARLSALQYHGGSEPAANGALMQAAPWLRKQPATDLLYGIRGGGPDIGHFIDEMRNAVTGENVPANLAVRPESLNRMSFPQAVEHVGRINQYRAAEMERAAASRMDNPAIHPYKDYPEGGLRWVQLRLPELGDDLGGYRIAEEPNVYHGGAPGHVIYDPTGREMNVARTREDALRHIQTDRYRGGLSEALKQEGDAMGHCVGGYCDEVANGRSNIYSLRDAKGMPHVTIETAPGQLEDLRSRVPLDVQSQIADEFGGLNTGRDFNRAMVEWAQKNMDVPHDIIQIKGKQNRAPNAEYLPFVQDFVKSGQWGQIGDLSNAQLTYLPDQRLVSHADIDKISQSPQALEMFGGDAEAARKNLAPWNLKTFSPEDWEQTKHLFEGYKRGGLAAKTNCGCAKCAGGLAVRRA